MYKICYNACLPSIDTTEGIKRKALQNVIGGDGGMFSSRRLFSLGLKKRKSDYIVTGKGYLSIV